MKTVLKVITIVTLILACLSFAACGEGYADGGAAPPTSEDGGQIVDTSVNRKIVYSVSMNVKAPDVAELKSALAKKNTELGGYVEQNNENYTDGECISASITFRVPTEKLDEFISNIEGRGGVESKTVTTVDITTKYVNAEAKRSSLAERKRLLLEMLEDVSIGAADRISIIEEISEVDTELEEIDRLITEYDSDLGYSTVSVYISEAADPMDTLISAVVTLLILVVIPGIVLATVFIVRKKKAKK